MKRFFKRLYCHYLMFFGVYNALFVLILCLTCITDLSLIIGLGVFQVVETYFIWYKRVWKNREDVNYLFGNISQNNLLAIYGGIGTGKSTLANYILNTYVPNKELRYYNYFKKDCRCFSHDYLFMKKSLPDGAGVLIDEAGRTYDSFAGNYDKTKDVERSRILFFNKFFRQFYTDKALCIYVDQTEANLNTALRRTIFYVIQCRGVQFKAMPLLLGGFYAFLNAMFKWTSYNIFALYDIDFMDFNKVGDYADHYSLNYDAKDVKHFIRPAVDLFSNNDTYVFRKYNPNIYNESEDYIWGSDVDIDSFYMEKNFDFSALSDEFKH